jgi:hypothetical protein
MKTKRLLVLFAIVLMLALAAQGSLSFVAQARAQAAPGEGPGVFLPLMMLGKSPSSTIFGIEVSSLANTQTYTRMQDADPTWIRRNSLDWSQVQPTKNGGYNWSAASALEADMIKASQMGSKLLLIVRGTPTWAQKYAGSGCGPIATSEFSSFGSFLNAAVQRYSVAPYNVKYWEIYNEEDGPITYDNSVFGCWGDATQPYFGGQYYGNMLATVIPSMRQANSNIKIVNGGLLLDCDPSLSTCKDPAMAGFLEGMIKANAVSQLDYVNFHAYDYQGARLGVFGNAGNWGTTYETVPVLVPKLNFLKNVLNKYGLGNKPLMNSEVALLKTPGTATCDALCQQNKAMYVGRVYPVAIAEGLVANIWYQADNGWNNSGLFGGPMYDSFVFARNELDDATVTHEITQFDSSSNVDGYELDRGDIKVWVLWSHDLANHTISLPGTPKAVYTWKPDNGPYVSGTPSASQVVGIFPVYLEWTK